MYWGIAWHRGLCIHFPSLPSVLECGFKSREGFEQFGMNMWHFLKRVVGSFY